MLGEEEFAELQERTRSNLDNPEIEPYSKEALQNLSEICSPDQITELLCIKAEGSNKTILDDLPSAEVGVLLNDLGLDNKRKLAVLQGMDPTTEKAPEVVNLIEQLQIAELEKGSRVAKLMEQDAATGKTPLHRADGDVEQIKPLLEGIPAEDQVKILKIKDNDGKTPLDNATTQDLEKLLGGLKLNNEQKLTVLMEMDADSQQEPEVKKLIDEVMEEQDKISSLKKQSPDLGLSPLHRANGKIDEIAKSLEGIPAADQVTLLKLKDKSGRTPLDYVKPEDLKKLLDDSLKLEPKQQYEVLLNAKEVEVLKEAYNIQRNTPKLEDREDRFEMLKMKRDVDGKTMLHIPKAAADMKPLLLKDLTPAQRTTLLKTPDAEGKTPLDNIPSNEVMGLLNDQDLGLAPKQKYEAMLNMKKSLNSQDILATLSAGVKTNPNKTKDVTEKLEMLKMQREDDGKTFLHVAPNQPVMTLVLMDITDKQEIVNILKLRDKDNKTALDYISKQSVINLLDGESLKLDAKQKYEILLNTDRVYKVILDVLKDIPANEKFEMLKMQRDVDGKTMLHIPRNIKDLKTVLDGVDPKQISELLSITDNDGKTPLEKFSVAQAQALLADLGVPLPEQEKLMEPVKKAEEIRTAAEAAKIAAAKIAAAKAAAKAADLAPSVDNPNMSSPSPYHHLSKNSSAHQLDSEGRKTWREENFKTEGGVTTALIGDQSKGHFKQTRTADGKFEYEVVNSRGDSEDRIQVLTVPRKGGGKPDIIKFDKAGNVTFFEEGGPGGQSKIGPETMKKIQAFEEGKSLAHVAEEKAPAPKVVQKAADKELEPAKGAGVHPKASDKKETNKEKFKRESEERGKLNPQTRMNKTNSTGRSFEI